MCSRAMEIIPNLRRKIATLEEELKKLGEEKTEIAFDHVMVFLCVLSVSICKGMNVMR
ncbi:hypothetical protein PHJA_001318900 [Phtheirospermum japonicum]|uniref:Uncharacterized protein n=1 Tax=Phtheirospermum japonicum TaxID=374723 RepID=A0A830BYS5_9LAMI|nr:hypothetical protein PHJA_001318900 [Phtheirospermum japonicum]